MMIIKCVTLLQISAASYLMSKKRVPDELAQIGQYRILKTIGKGSFAKVKLGRHITTNVEVISSVFWL